MQTDKYKIIDLDNWHRKEIYRLYTEEWTTCCHTLNVELDVSELVRFTKSAKLKLAPVLIWLATKELNKQSNFRMTVTGGELREWEVIHPRYPVLNTNNDITFHYAPYSADFKKFYKAYLFDCEINADKTGAFASEMPVNVYSISIVSGVPFASCTFDLKNAKDYLSPLVFMGKYYRRGKKLKLMCSLTINHAAADGYHSGEFFKGLQESMDCFGLTYEND